MVTRKRAKGAKDERPKKKANSKAARERADTQLTLQRAVVADPGSLLLCRPLLQSRAFVPLCHPRRSAAISRPCAAAFWAQRVARDPKPKQRSERDRPYATPRSSLRASTCRLTVRTTAALPLPLRSLSIVPSTLARATLPADVNIPLAPRLSRRAARCSPLSSPFPRIAPSPLPSIVPTQSSLAYVAAFSPLACMHCQPSISQTSDRVFLPISFKPLSAAGRVRRRAIESAAATCQHERCRGLRMRSRARESCANSRSSPRGVEIT